MKRAQQSAPVEGACLVKEGGRRRPPASVVGLAAFCLAMAASSVAVATEYTVVVLQSLTGPMAFVGVPGKDGMLLAAEEINRNQELGKGNSMKVVVADDGTDRAQALALVTRYAADPKVLMMLGPTSSAAAVTGSHAANELKFPILSTSNSYDVLNAGPWSHILTQPANVTVPVMVDYAVEKLKVKDCTIIGVSDVETFMSMQRVFESGVKARGVRIGAVESIKGADSDFSAVATKVANRDQDCVFVSATASQSANIVIQLRQAGLDPKVRILGHVTQASPEFVQRGGQAVEGVMLMGDWVPGGADDFGRAFATAFKAKYNKDADQWAAVGYGGMRIAAAAIRAAGPNPTRDAVRAALSKSKDVPVVVGQGRWSLDDQRVPHSGMKILTVQNGKFMLAP